MWVRGLKHQSFSAMSRLTLVAPYVGAWIETNRFVVSFNVGYVAPYVGAWIETKG